MDERDMVNEVISHINSAKAGIEQFPRSGMNAKALAELDLVYQNLNDSINHCLGIFGPTTLKDW